MMRRRRDKPNPRSGVADLGDPGIDLLARQLAAFTRFGPLRHFDLQFFGFYEVEAGHAKAPGSYLLDGTVLGISIRKRDIPFRIFTAFTGIALAANPVHRDSQRFVRLLADRAVAHGAGLEALHDGFDRLDIFNRD